MVVTKQNSKNLKKCSNKTGEMANPKLNNLNYKQTSVIKENSAVSIFGINVNEKFRKEGEPLILAAVGGRFIWFYEILNSKSNDNTAFMGAFEDKDEEEDFYCCDWSFYVPPQNRTDLYGTGDFSSCIGGQHIVACGGRKGVIRIVSPNVAQSIINLESHGEAVNELKFHPKAVDLLFSFSKDYTIRLWNVWTSVLVCIFGGCEGHRSEILHGDIDMTGEWLLSCGMDHTMKIWKISDNDNESGDRISAAIKKSRQWTETKVAFPTDLQHYPVFSSNKIHKNYIDCGRWFGRMILSKSCDGYMSLWKPGNLDSLDLSFKIGQETKECILHQFELPGSEIWYIRFDLDAEKGLVAWGNRSGQVFIWDFRQGQFSENSVFDVEPIVLNVYLGARNLASISNVAESPSSNVGDTNVQATTISAASSVLIRQTRFVDNCQILLCALDKGTIVRFDLQ